MVGMNHRYRPDVQIVRSFVQSGELGSDRERARQLACVPAGPRRSSAGGSVAISPAAARCSISASRSSISASGWRQSRAGAGECLRWTAGPGAAVEQSGSAFVVCEDAISIFVDVTWRHIGEGERFGVGLRGSKGTAAINPLTVWKELHGVPTDVSPTGSVSRENAFTASFRAEWAHFPAAIAGEAKAPIAPGSCRSAQGDRRDLSLGGGRPRRGPVRLARLALPLLVAAGPSDARGPLFRSPSAPSRAPSSPSTS